MTTYGLILASLLMAADSASANQPAERDFHVAEFYQRTGHPGSAYFYYELVRRRYPGTAFADKASHRMEDMLAPAVRDFQVAEFYQRTGHPGSAYFYYELVRRRYPGTNFAEKARERLEELKK